MSETQAQTKSPSDSPSAKGSYIQILTDDAPFEWSYEDLPGSVFMLRVVPKERAKQIRRENTATKWKHGERVEVPDWDAISDQYLDEAIVSWGNIKGRRADGSVIDLPCELRYKVKLPERVKGEIVRICVGGETSEVGGK